MITNQIKVFIFSFYYLFLNFSCFDLFLTFHYFASKSSIHSARAVEGEFHFFFVLSFIFIFFIFFFFIFFVFFLLFFFFFFIYGAWAFDGDFFFFFFFSFFLIFFFNFPCFFPSRSSVRSYGWCMGCGR